MITVPALHHILYFVGINLFIVLSGYQIIKRRNVWVGWLLAIISIPSIYLLFKHEHPVLLMLAVIATTFTAMKVITVTESYKSQTLSLSFKQWTCFATAWAGMRAEPFERLGSPPLPDAWPMIRFGISRIIGGALLIVFAHFLNSYQLNDSLKYVLISTMLLIAFSLILHFGLLNISAGVWRLFGVNTYYLFRKPAKATSLSEFWSKRWNLAFSEMTSIIIFRPLKDKIDHQSALLLSFLFSGLLHELALSLPVNSGYGLPMIYFIIQAGVVLAEKKIISKTDHFLNNRIWSHIWVFFWLVLPAPLLFHVAFIKEIVWPLAGF